MQRRRVAPHGAGSGEGGLGGFCWLTRRDAGGLRWRRPWQLDSRDWPGDLEPACLGLGLTETQKRVMKVCMTVQTANSDGQGYVRVDQTVTVTGTFICLHSSRIPVVERGGEGKG